MVVPESLKVESSLMWPPAVTPPPRLTFSHHLCYARPRTRRSQQCPSHLVLLKENHILAFEFLPNFRNIPEKGFLGVSGFTFEKRDMREASRLRICLDSNVL